MAGSVASNMPLLSFSSLSLLCRRLLHDSFNRHIACTLARIASRGAIIEAEENTEGWQA